MSNKFKYLLFLLLAQYLYADDDYGKNLNALLSTSEAIIFYEDELLQERLGDIRNSGDREFWLKGKSSDNRISDSSVANSKFKSNGFKFGFNKRSDNSFYGLFGGYSSGDLKTSFSKNDFKNYSLGAYYTYAPISGLYMDLSAKYILSRQKFRLFFSKNKDINMFLGSIEAGYRILSMSDFFIDPSAKFSISYIEDYHIDDIKVSAQKPMFYKIGVQAGKMFNLLGLDITPSVGLHYENKIDKDSGKIKYSNYYSDHSFDALDSARYILNASANINFNSLSLFGRYKRSYRGGFKTKSDIDVGLRYSF